MVGDMNKSVHMALSEAAELLGESRSTVHRRIRKGELSAEKVAGARGLWILKRDEVLALAASLNAGRKAEVARLDAELKSARRSA